MALAVIGTGLTSPSGLTPREHAFCLRAGPAFAAGGAFVDAQGEPLQVAYCPWLAPAAPTAERLVDLATRALASALAPLAPIRARGGAAGDAPIALRVCTAGLRPGLSEADRQACEQALGAACGARQPARLEGAAGFFEALAEAPALLRGGQARAVAIVAADSLVSLEALAAHAQRPPPPWLREPPRPSEAAAAIVVMDPAEARKLGLRAIGAVHHAATKVGGAADDNDEPVDGTAMTALLAEMPRLPGPVTRSFGQHQVDPLRMREWDYAAARMIRRFDPSCLLDCVEARIGAVGAAAGGVYCAYALAASRHRTTEGDAAQPAIAWAISARGARGIAALGAEAPS